MKTHSKQGRKWTITIVYVASSFLPGKELTQSDLGQISAYHGTDFWRID
jgi:hypothetical protein